ncbi:hypothetical protein [Streptomyces sp. DHE17-7]|uniref:hypothetical protein n=1 Tax=Streptomyces sp. DHE17-7 TaxID=2759949 RepID=UPI002FCE0A73|nr:hypothetical protein [Streptomyces sp. DHE17-7]
MRRPHERFPDWIAGLARRHPRLPGPRQLRGPSHRLMRELADSPRWRGRLAGTLRHDDAVLGPEDYLAHLRPGAPPVWEPLIRCCRVRTP